MGISKTRKVVCPMSQGHSTTCADAVRTTPAECQCQCEGLFHGGPHSERARALVWPADKRRRYSGTRLSRAKGEARDALSVGVSIGEACTDFAVTHAIDELILTTDPGQHDAVRDVLGAVIEAFVGEIVDAELGEEDSRRIKTLVNYDHVLCTLCVESLKLLDEVRASANKAADAVADAVIGTVDGNLLTEAVKVVLRTALQKAFGVLIDLLADPAKVTSIQLLGLLSCPDVSEHPDVEKYCVAPLTGEYVTAAMRDWINKGFPKDAAVLGRAPRRDRS